MANRILFLILAIVLFCVSVILQYSISKKFFKKNLDTLNRWIEGRFLLALFFPKVYFSKKNFWKGYLLYLLSIFLLILGFVAFYIWLIIKGVS